MDIATVVEEIVHEDENKVLKSDVIADMAEDAVDGYCIPPSIHRTQPSIEVFDVKPQLWL
jgi:hypothetical protein